MGGAASKKLVCPVDYDKNKFNMILKLYDQLDSNGDQVIETLELKDIAGLHIKNRQTELSKLIENEQQDYNYLIQKAKLKYEKDKSDLQIRYEQNVEKINNSHSRNDESIKNKIANLNDLNEKEKCQKFMNVVSNDGKHIEFWKFFEYMKNRTQDIKNIEFSN
mgnify:FL=1|jgi:hypothetical protein